MKPLFIKQKTMKPISVLIIDDHQLVAESISAYLEDDGNLRVAGIASNGYEALNLLPYEQVDVILMDIKLPGLNGIESTRFIKDHYPAVKVLGLSIFDNKELILDMIRAGASGFLLKSNASEELKCAIRTLGKGGHYFSKEIRERMAHEASINNASVK